MTQNLLGIIFIRGIEYLDMFFVKKKKKKAKQLTVY